MINKEKKDYSRSVRMTNTVYEFVDKFEGNGFNEKFENLVLHCMAALPNMDAQLADREKRLKDINSKIASRESLLRDIDSIKWSLEQVLNKATALNKTEM